MIFNQDQVWVIGLFLVVFFPLRKYLPCLSYKYYLLFEVKILHSHFRPVQLKIFNN